ncbi:hypothetical protein B0T26DRAFT_806030 [Lasiosphaeria miniovina]|uniref:Uncharacterized protein n=1 Tax=Lasiosphaeria miniovina TaxID=1954250 RepID=A0AA39ZYV5_9PEZI|nr:uncharacterized protein B0T26DRAFT_806030 [Lasiosphaeria miniovina]KAK0706187.1 hypothetical protein B0T26DRAFT_806030 [Lasiosphaeria miniovina]
MEATLDPASLVCQADWETVFSPRSWEALLGAATASDGIQPHIKQFCYTTTWEAVHAAAKQGCNWCHLILLRKCTTGKSCILYTTACDLAAKYIAARERITDVSTPESCPQPSATTLLPDCVIDCSDTNNPRLTLTGGEQRTPYLALSYHYPLHPPAHVSNGIPLSILPPTVRDAITDSEADKAHQLGETGLVSIVFMYTLRQISREDDKLPAVGGVAEQYASVTGDQYLARLWRGSLLFDLLWSVADEAPFSEVRCASLRIRALVKTEVAFQGKGLYGPILAGRGDEDKEEIGIAKLDADEPRSGDMVVVPLMWDAQGSFVWGLVLEWMPTKQFRRISKFENSHRQKRVEWVNGLEAQVLDIV